MNVKSVFKDSNTAQLEGALEQPQRPLRQQVPLAYSPRALSTETVEPEQSSTCTATEIAG